MPSASYRPPRPIADLDEAAAALREEGLRFSASRRTVLEGLLLAEGPVSAEYLADGLEGRTSPCDLPSTYRNLELFERLGMVRHVHIGHGPGLYALAGAGEHTYLVCEQCKRLSRLPIDEVERIRARIDETTGFEAHFTHFPILGLCASCAGNGGDASEGAVHEHEHSHGDRVHAHPHGPEREHEHPHDS